MLTELLSETLHSDLVAAQSELSESRAYADVLTKALQRGERLPATKPE